MQTQPIHTSILLGSGGNEPALQWCSVPSLQEGTLQLDCGQSVYTIDIDAHLAQVAIGTRTGEVFLFALSTHSSESEHRRDRLVVGSPVLSMCIVDSSTIAISTVDRRCLLWRHSCAGVAPRLLPTDGGTCVALSRYSGNRVAGLCANGLLRLWETPNCKISRDYSVPCPAPIGAMVPLIHWCDDDSLAYPGPNGALVRCHVETSDVRMDCAHAGDFYAMALLGDGLLTIGAADRTYKLWLPKSAAPTIDGPTPDDIVSCTPADDQGDRIVGVTSEGQANLYRIAGNGLEREKVLMGSDHRIVTGPGLVALRDRRIAAEGDEVRVLTRTVRTIVYAEDDQDIEQPLARITTLGYPHVTLALRAEAAQVHGNELSELRHRKELFDLLRDQHAVALWNHDRYTQLLKKFWILDEAAQAYAAIDGNNDAPELDRLCPKHHELLQRNTCIIDPGIEIEALIDASTAVDRAFSGMFALNILPASACPGITITADEVAEHYERERGANPKNALPASSQAAIWWISHTESKQHETVLFGGNRALESLVLVIQWFHDGIQTIHRPSVIFEAPAAEPGISPKNHNARLLNALKEIQDGALARSWLEGVYAAVRTAIGKAINARGVGHFG